MVTIMLVFQSPRGVGVVQTLAVRGWFRLQTHEPAWLCGKLGFEFLKNIYFVSFLPPFIL